MKACSKCKVEYAEQDFGRSFYCRPCEAARQRARRAANPGIDRDQWKSVPKETRAFRHKRWRQANIERERERRRLSYQENRERELEQGKRYKAENKERLAAYQAEKLKQNPVPNRFARSLRRAAEKNAMPPWADKKKMKAIYAEAARLANETGIPHEVDHIYPLQSKIMCGLHVETNLQILTSAENRSKSNRRWPDAGLSAQV